MSLREEFKDTDYRRAYAESFANSVIATQIRLLRGSMSQKEFADLVGIKQSRVSAMEDENYSMWSTKTLKKLAASKDVVFLGRFVSFGELLNWSSAMSEESLVVRPFADDPAFSGTGRTTIVIGTGNEAQFSTMKIIGVGGTSLAVPKLATTISVSAKALPQKTDKPLKLVVPDVEAA